MILIIAAMEEEYQGLQTYIENQSEGFCFNIKYHRGNINNQDVILILSGVGKVNASNAITTIINQFTIDFVVNIGSAGGIKNNYDVKVLDIIIAKKVVQHDVDLTLANYDLGVLPKLPKYYECALSNDILANLSSTELNIHVATIASGDQFVGTLEKVENINEHFEDVCAIEMEAGAIAQVCYLRNIPYIVVRSISDVVNDTANHIQFDEYIIQASKNSALVAYEIIRNLK